MKAIILFSVIAILTILFFIGGPDAHSARSFRAFWNLGHIVYYAILPMAIFILTRNKPSTVGAQITVILIVTLVLGIVVELVQADFNRTPDIGDLFRNLIGAAFGITYILPSRKTLPKRLLPVLQGATLLLIAFQVYPVATAVTDECQARSQFPVLADFENPYELDRWTGAAGRAIDDTIKHSGNHSMRVSMDTSLYSGVSLSYFPGDWTGFSQFQCSIYNPDMDPLTMTCRIHDLAHTRGIQRYQDRYNQSFTLATGWNTITIELETVKNAPIDRAMDMRHILGIGIFATRLPQPRVVYIDDVRLVR